MDKKYVINADDNNMIYRVCVNTEEGQKIINITDRNDKEKFMQQLNKIDEEYGDFYQHLYGGNCYIIKQNYNSEIQELSDSMSKVEDNSKIDTDRLWVACGNLDNLSFSKGYDAVISEVRRNSISSNDGECLLKYLPNSLSVDKNGLDLPILYVTFSFVHLVNEKKVPVNNEISKFIEDSIVYVNFYTSSKNKYDAQIGVSGYVKFSDFIKYLSDSGYFMSDSVVSLSSGEVPSKSNLYDKNNELKLSALKEKVSERIEVDPEFGVFGFYSFEFWPAELLVKDKNKTSRS